MQVDDMPFGYHGFYLRVDVTLGVAEHVPLPEAVLRQVIAPSGGQVRGDRVGVAPARPAQQRRDAGFAAWTGAAWTGAAWAGAAWPGAVWPSAVRSFAVGDSGRHEANLGTLAINVKVLVNHHA